MKNDDWWKPEKLKSREQNFLQNNKLDILNTNNDFGSYKIMLLKNDLKKSNIHLHNEIYPDYRLKIIKRLLKNFSPKAIIDIGCGLGFTTNIIKKNYPRADVKGIDISNNAITYAKKKFPKCEFICDAIDPKNKTQEFNCDLITAFEFYPFSRTNKFNDHVNYIKHITNNLHLGGKLIIMQQWNNSTSISKNIKKLKSHFYYLDFQIYDAPFKRIAIIIKYMSLALFFSKIIEFIINFFLKKKIRKNKILIITKKFNNKK